MKRAAARAGGGAYEGAFEAVGAILIATGLGYWFDQRYETTPIGVLVGAGIGFGAFVLRLIRLGRRLHSEPGASAQTPVAGVEGRAGATSDADLGVGEEPGVSDVLRREED